MTDVNDLLTKKYKFHWFKALLIFITLPYFAIGFAIYFVIKRLGR